MEQIRRCEAVTTRGGRCRKKAELYRKHSDGREYLSCRRHELYFRPHPSIARVKEAAADGGK
jgi:hypothetical protein